MNVNNKPSNKAPTTDSASTMHAISQLNILNFYRQLILLLLLEPFEWWWMLGWARPDLNRSPSVPNARVLAKLTHGPNGSPTSGPIIRLQSRTCHSSSLNFNSSPCEYAISIKSKARKVIFILANDLTTFSALIIPSTAALRRHSVKR